MTTLNVSAAFARAARRSQVAYGLTSFAYLRYGVVVGTSFGNIMIFGWIVVRKIFITSRRIVAKVGTLALRLEGIIVASLARIARKRIDLVVALIGMARWKKALRDIVGNGQLASDKIDRCYVRPRGRYPFLQQIRGELLVR